MIRLVIGLSTPAGTIIVSAPLPLLFFLSFPAKLSSWVPIFSRAACEEEDGLEAIVLVARTAVEEDEGRQIGNGNRRRFFAELVAPLTGALLALRPTTGQARRVVHPAVIEGAVILKRSRRGNAGASLPPNSKVRKNVFFYPLETHFLSFTLSPSKRTSACWLKLKLEHHVCILLPCCCAAEPPHDCVRISGSAAAESKSFDADIQTTSQHYRRRRGGISFVGPQAHQQAGMGRYVCDRIGKSEEAEQRDACYRS
jgi:hypothetical protein